MNPKHSPITDQTSPTLAAHVAHEAKFRTLIEVGQCALRTGRTVEHASVVAAFARITGSAT